LQFPLPVQYFDIDQSDVISLKHHLLTQAGAELQKAAPPSFTKAVNAQETSPGPGCACQDPPALSASAQEVGTAASGAPPLAVAATAAGNHTGVVSSATVPLVAATAAEATTAPQPPLPAPGSTKLEGGLAFPLTAASWQGIAADLSKQQLADVLLPSGFNPEVPTVWVAEALIYYLRLPQVRNRNVFVVQIVEPCLTGLP
jgi:hypothetical protein